MSRELRTATPLVHFAQHSNNEVEQHLNHIIRFERASNNAPPHGGNLAIFEPLTE